MSLNFQEISTSIVGNNAARAGTNKMVEKSAGDQIKFAQEVLLKQLQHQFPGSEFDTNKMVESIMGMVTLAQNTKMVETFEKNLKLQTALFSSSLSDFEGEIVEHAGNTFDYRGEAQEIIYNLPDKVENAHLYILNNQDQVIKIIEVDPKPGRNKFVWDGKNVDDYDVDNGIYKVALIAKDENDKNIDGWIRLRSRVTSVSYDQDELAVLMSGEVPIFDVKRRHFVEPPYQNQKITNSLSTQTMEIEA